MSIPSTRRVGSRIITAGFHDAHGFELTASLGDSDLQVDVGRLLLVLGRAQTLPHPDTAEPVLLESGMAILKRVGPDLVEVWENDFLNRTYVAGLDFTATLTRYQQEVCDRFMSSYQPPNPETLTTISEHASAAPVIEGVRYGDMGASHSGWIIVEHGYRGPVEELQTQHTSHVYRLRPDIGALLALAPGFRFLKGADSTDVWSETE